MAMDNLVFILAIEGWIIPRDVHILRNAIFGLLDPLPLVTKNHRNPYILTMVRNKSLTPSLLERYVIYGRTPRNVSRIQNAE
jgi:hypothetical protein